jgi:hypothetical protein
MQIATGPSILGYQATKAASSTSSTKMPAANDGGITQANEDSAPNESSVEADFLKYAKMTPFDRMRAGILKSMNLTEDDLAKMSPDQQKAVEEKIRDAIEKQLEKQGQKTGSLVDLSA